MSETWTRSWIEGIWFVVPCAVAGLICEEGLELPLRVSVAAAVMTGVAVVVCRKLWR